MNDVPNRGDIVMFQFNPQAGHEQQGYRPAITLSSYEFNRKTGFALLCPITRQQKGYPFEVVLPGDLTTEGVVLADQVKSLDYQARPMKIIEQAPSQVIRSCTQLIEKILNE